VSRVGGTCRSGLAAAEPVLPHVHASEELAGVEGAGWRNRLGMERGSAGEKGEIEKLGAR
jgi:hypothetical protein